MSQVSVPWQHRQPTSYNPLARLLIAVATVVYRLAAPIVRAIPGPILLGAVVMSILLSWGCMGLFGVVDDIVASPANTEAVSTLAWPLTADPSELQGLPPHVVSVNELDPLRELKLVGQDRPGIAQRLSPTRSAVIASSDVVSVSTAISRAPANSSTSSFSAALSCTRR